MKKLLLATTAIAVMMGSVSSAASSSLAYETRLAQKETLEAAGKKYYGDVAGDGWSTCISGLCFIGEDTLTPGTLKPAVTNARDLLLASKAVGNDVLVASADNSFVFVKSPFIEELAEQNSVSYEYMASLLWDHSIDAPTNADGEVITWQEAMQAETIKIAAMADLISNGEAGFDYEGGYAELQSVIEMLEADAVGNAVAIEALNTKIAELESNADINAKSITDLNSDVTHWKELSELYNDGYTAATEEAAVKVKQDEITDLNKRIDDLVEAGRLDQKQINDLVAARDNLQAQIDAIDPDKIYTQSDIDSVSYDITINGETKTISKDGIKAFTITTEDGHHSTVSVNGLKLTVDNADGTIDSYDLQDVYTAATEEAAVNAVDRIGGATKTADGYVTIELSNGNTISANIKPWLDSAYTDGADSIDITSDNQEAIDNYIDGREFEDGVNINNWHETLANNAERNQNIGAVTVAVHEAERLYADLDLAGTPGKVSDVLRKVYLHGINDGFAQVSAGLLEGLSATDYNYEFDTWDISQDFGPVVAEIVEAEVKAAYKEGYKDGYAQGYIDGVNSVVNK